MAGGAIVFDGVWKKFQRGERHDSLRDAIPALGRHLLGRRRPEQLERQEFWAVQDVSFEVKPGQALGLIGSNGAGKSTVLKLLTKILRPTRGHCEVHGRIGALIEVSAAFHPDLTGRENVFLQGGIMGMKRAEIARKFDEIVEFSELRDFIDTPVKRYSSGMHARLGFSIAAHLDSDVLIVDEVLSVGDFSFQQRALDRIKQMVKQDIPVVVVSHQLETVTTLCTHAILLEKGRVAYAGSPSDTISHYVVDRSSPAQVLAEQPVRLDSVSLSSAERVKSGDTIEVTVRGSIEWHARNLEPVCVYVRSLGTREIVFATSNVRCNVDLPQSGPFELNVELQLNLPPGLYAIETGAWDGTTQQHAGHGPSASILVEGGPSFWGTVQLNPCMRLASQSLAPAGGAARAR